MLSATVDIGAPLDSSMGAMFLGTLISGVLHGICLVQAFFYFTNYPNDPWIIRSMVLTTVSFDMIHLSFITHAMYHYLVTHFRREEMLQRIIWSVVMEALFTGVNAGIVQTFYTYRVWKLSKRNWFLSGFIVALILATTGCGIAWVVIAIQFNSYTELLTINPLTITINALSTAVDVIIAATLCYLLNQSRTGFKRSDTIINKLMLFVVNTGVLTTMCAVSSLICLVAAPRTLIYASFYFCIGRFYTNSFLATLNARRSMSGSSHNSDNTSHMVISAPTSASASHHFGSRNHVLSTSHSKGQDIAIRIETTREVSEMEMEDHKMSRTRCNRERERKVDPHADDNSTLHSDDKTESSTTKAGPL